MGKRPGSTLRQTLEPYARRFSKLMTCPVLVHCYALALFSSVAWDASLGPALATIARQDLSMDMAPNEIRERICGDVGDATSIQIDVDFLISILRSAKVPWIS